MNVLLKCLLLAVLGLLLGVNQSCGDPPFCLTLGDTSCITNTSCNVNETLLCCPTGFYVRAVIVPGNKVSYCTCDVPSTYNTGYRCTFRSEVVPPENHAVVTSTSWMTCAILFASLVLRMAS